MLIVVLSNAFNGSVCAQEDYEELNKQAYNLYHNEKNYAEAKKLYLKCIELYKSEGKLKDAILDSYNAYRSSTANMDPLDEAKNILLDALQFIDDDNKNSREVATLYSGLGVVYNRIYQYENSQYYLNKSIQIFKAIEVCPFERFYYDVLVYRGINQIELYNYEEAKVALKEALNFAQIYDLDKSHVMTNITRLYSETKDYSGLNMFLKDHNNAVIIENAPLFIYFDIYNDIIKANRDQGKLQEALKYQKQLAQRINASSYKIHFSERYTAMGFAAIYQDMDEHKKAINILKQNDDAETRKLKPSEASMCDLMIAESYLELNDFSNASDYLKKSFRFNSDTFYSQDLKFNFKKMDVNLLEKLAVLGEFYKRQQVKANNQKLREKIIKVYKTAHKALLEFSRSSDEDRFITETNYKYIYGNLLDSYWEQWNLTKTEAIFYDALNITDESKLVAIASELKSVRLDQLFKENIDVEILEKEIKLTAEIDSLKRLIDLSDSKKTSEILKSRQKEFQVFKDKLEAEQPKYFLHKYGEEFSVKDKINKLHKNHNIIEYFVGDSTIFVFKAYKDQLIFDKLPLSKILKKNISKFILNVGSYTNDNYKTEGRFIYEKLFKKYLITESKNIIVLDDLLQKIPVEALWTSNDDTSGQFLINTFDILRSNSIKQENEHLIKHSNKQQSLIFAPFVNSGNSINGKLPSSLKEVEYISSLFKSVIYIDDEASKSKFTSTISKQKLVHLATHSEVNSEVPSHSKIYFYSSENNLPEDTYLTLEELYKLSLNAHLVTLSSCETGIGKELKGRGVMSFSNALTFAGAKSTVMSLWKVPDENSSRIMMSFYESLYQGLDKDKALKAAKLNYLNTTEDNDLAHPYYWAGFVLSGDTEPIINNSLNYLWYVTFAVLFAIILMILLKRFKKL
ncbi:hypothetical protein WPG_1031 [Winogradskyella sp. PG-2]|nr:hypothetical protein WPG_1031 [Winogradskyella sp. PG-2]